MRREAPGRAKYSGPYLSLSMIVKNEAAGLTRCLDSIAPYVDEIVICDTGSADDTVSLAERYTTRVYPIPWRNNFAAARQEALELARGEWVLWLDGDDEVEGGQHIRMACLGAGARVHSLAFRYQLGAAGSPGHTEFWRERVVRRGSHSWRGAAHEVLVPRIPGEQKRIPQVLVTHHGKPGTTLAALQRNVRLLARELELQAIKDSRTLFYLARDLLLLGEHARALPHFQHYQALASWPDERYLAYLYMAECQLQLGSPQEAVHAAIAAVELVPSWPLAYFKLAELAYYRGAWSHVITWCDIGRRQGGMETPLFINPAAAVSGWLIYYTVALYHTGRLADAFAWTQKALELLPNDPQHTYNLAVFGTLLERSAAAAAR